jgi:hypothetical protein
MDVQVLYDNEGQVIAVAVPLPPAYDFTTPRSGAVASEGQQSAVLALPDGFADLSLGEISDRLRVNTEGEPRLEASS